MVMMMMMMMSVVMFSTKARSSTQVEAAEGRSRKLCRWSGSRRRQRRRTRCVVPAWLIRSAVTKPIGTLWSQISSFFMCSHKLNVTGPRAVVLFIFCWVPTTPVYSGMARLSWSWLFSYIQLTVIKFLYCLRTDEAIGFFLNSNKVTR